VVDLVNLFNGNSRTDFCFVRSCDFRTRGAGSDFADDGKIEVAVAGGAMPGAALYGRT
jgi:hypothetical protein